MPGRIEGYEPIFAAVVYVPAWKARLWNLLKKKGKK